MLHFTFQNMRAFYGPWPRGLGLNAAVQMWNTVIRVCTVHRNKSCETNQGNKGVQNVYKSVEALYMSTAA